MTKENDIKKINETMYQSYLMYLCIKNKDLSYIDFLKLYFSDKGEIF